MNLFLLIPPFAALPTTDVSMILFKQGFALQTLLTWLISLKTLNVVLNQTSNKSVEALSILEKNLRSTHLFLFSLFTS